MTLEKFLNNILQILPNSFYTFCYKCYHSLPPLIKGIVSRLVYKPKISKTAYATYETEFGRDVKIGEYSFIGRNSFLIQAHIGNYTHIGRKISVIMGHHNIKDFSTYNFYGTQNSYFFHSDKLPEKFRDAGILKEKSRSIAKIGNDVWIGENVTILSGVHIGDGAVIGSCSFVNRDIPPYAVAVGIPCKVIKYRFSEDIIKKLQELAWWDWPPEKLLSEFEMLSNLVKEKDENKP